MRPGLDPKQQWRFLRMLLPQVVLTLVHCQEISDDDDSFQPNFRPLDTKGSPLLDILNAILDFLWYYLFQSQKIYLQRKTSNF